ncbi:hypothetical protein [Acidithiobacillus ferriphilus]|uniref:hypothetical protein n=1 Tax=Acidithiobacillus ferriphilus TaxID=1689834 RepID=UPI002DB8E6D1|nr:hypothetical protein [Acidithiobacillus ferriphilus]
MAILIVAFSFCLRFRLGEIVLIARLLWPDKRQKMIRAFAHDGAKLDMSSLPHSPSDDSRRISSPSNVTVTDQFPGITLPPFCMAPLLMRIHHSLKITAVP